MCGCDYLLKLESFEHSITTVCGSCINGSIKDRFQASVYEDAEDSEEAVDVFR